MTPTEPVFSLQGKRVFVAGHKGMVGSAIVRRLAQENCTVLVADRAELDLTRQSDVENWMATNKPEVVFVAAAKVGGIHANNTRPADFLFENLVIEINLIDTAYRNGVSKLLFLGSSCIYPRNCAQPMREEALLTGALEPTNEAYAVAKIAGIKLCQAYRQQHGCDFISAMPTNVYGPGDRYDLMQGHVAAAMIMKVHAAKERGDSSIVIWGSGQPRREFLYSDDLADGCIFMMKHYSDTPHLNLGTGIDITISDLAQITGRVAGWQGEFVYDPSMPDGMPRKVMDVGRLAALGWTAPTSLEEGLKVAYDWYVQNVIEKNTA